MIKFIFLILSALLLVLAIAAAPEADDWLGYVLTIMSAFFSGGFAVASLASIANKS